MQRTSRVFALVATSLAGWACTGPPGPPGEAGQMGVSGYTVINVESETDTAPVKQVRANCPKGAVATGAGWSVLDPTGAILEGRSTYFQPAYDGSHWLVNAQNDSAFSPTWKLRVRVTCIRLPPAAPSTAAGSASSGSEF